MGKLDFMNCKRCVEDKHKGEGLGYCKHCGRVMWKRGPDGVLRPPGKSESEAK